jgi:hypothetical protein
MAVLPEWSAENTLYRSKAVYRRANRGAASTVKRGAVTPQQWSYYCDWCVYNICYSDYYSEWDCYNCLHYYGCGI